MNILKLKNLKKLLIETKKYNKCALISFEEKNFYNLGKLRTKLPKGLLFASTAKIKTIILKSKKYYLDVEEDFFDILFFENKISDVIEEVNLFQEEAVKLERVDKI